MAAPTVSAIQQPYDKVKMLWHRHKFVQGYEREALREPVPCLRCQTHHLCVCEDRPSILNADGYEIRAWRGVVV